MVGDMPSPDVILEAGISVLLATQGQYLEAYQVDCDLYAANLQRAAALRAGVAHLDVADPTRLQAEAMARSLEVNKPNHGGAAKSIGDLTDKIRKLSDSLAMHRPTGYSRVVVEVHTGGTQAEAWSAEPGNNLATSYTAEDDALIAEAENG